MIGMEFEIPDEDVYITETSARIGKKLIENLEDHFQYKVFLTSIHHEHGVSFLCVDENGDVPIKGFVEIL